MSETPCCVGRQTVDLKATALTHVACTGIQCRYASRHSAAQQQPVLQAAAAAAAASCNVEADGSAGTNNAEGSAAAVAGTQTACALASCGADAQEPAALRGSSLLVVENGTIIEDPAPGTGANLLHTSIRLRAVLGAPGCFTTVLSSSCAGICRKKDSGKSCRCR